MPTGKISIYLPANYPSILCNLGLLVAAAAEFVTAAVASYKSSRALCPCFRRTDNHDDDVQKNALVTSWLGKQSPIYVVTGSASTLGRGNKVPVIAMPRMMQYPLIPAPLGTIPSPIIPPSPPEKITHKRKKHLYSKCPPKEVSGRKVRKSRVKEKMTEADAVKTYTGLDKTIAEEFIDICDSRNVSLCSDSSCSRSSCNNSDGCGEFLGENKKTSSL